MPQTQLQHHLVEIADGLYQSSERLAQHIDAAAAAIVHSLTSGGKVLCAGEAEAAWLAHQAAHLLTLGAGRERPALAAVSVAGAGGLGVTAPAGQMDAQVRALGHPGDVWLAFSLEGAEGELAMATATARDMDLTLVVMTGDAASVLGPMVRDTDVWVPVPGRDAVELFSASWLALHGLMEAVDACLLGEEL
ncbi:MAG TPA: SIS domain-containing protein [Aquabacterium sp.]|nr:SIS domain-containing protein [Aquabacterium sp.]HRH27301.1 SIS domain-containing protein [Aquabacterium sp.]